MADPEPHPSLAPLAFLLGSWQGDGAGEYPTIKPFRYGEAVRFWHVGKPFVAYTQRTWDLGDGRPLHAESGYWRVEEDGTVELVLAHPTGLTEIQLGKAAGGVVELASSSVVCTPSAKQVTAVERSFELRGDVLAYEVRMAAVGQPLQHHLAAELHRAS